MERTRLPSVDAFARSLARVPAWSILPQPLLVEVAREAIEDARKTSADPERLAGETLSGLLARRPVRMVNATGVLLHTNLGRAPLHPEAADAAREVATGYANVEFDLAAGRRGERHAYLGRLAASLTGAEAGLAVTNNAAALVLSLAALAAPGGVAVSRGELIEIGGSFRLPELMAASGARMVEVGTTNRTRLGDYERVLPTVDALLKVHPSNYRVQGFAEATGYRELAGLADQSGIPFIADVGSGLLDTRTPWLPSAPPAWLAGEPGVRQTLEAGAGVVLFSGDKLLGGPQAGVIVGRRDLVARMAAHPLMRAMRLDGPTLAALTVTLELYGADRGAEIPFWRMATVDVTNLRTRIERVVAESGVDGEIVAGQSVPGAGSVPGETISSPVLAVADSGRLWRKLLDADPPILARLGIEALLIDLRCVLPEDDAHVAAALGTP